MLLFFSKVHPTKFLPKKKELNLIRERVARRIQGKVHLWKQPKIKKGRLVNQDTAKRRVSNRTLTK